METFRSVRNSIRKVDYALSVDLSDAYLHIPVHQATEVSAVGYRRTGLLFSELFPSVGIWLLGFSPR